ncbi:hypothetical protein [Azospirillum melinis]
MLPGTAADTSIFLGISFSAKKVSAIRCCSAITSASIGRRP